MEKEEKIESGSNCDKLRNEVETKKTALLLFLSDEELLTLFCAIEDAKEKAEEESKYGGCMGKAARRLFPEYDKMSELLHRAIMEAGLE